MPVLARASAASEGGGVADDADSVNPRRGIEHGGILRAASIVHNDDVAKTGAGEFRGKVYQSVVGPVSGNEDGYVAGTGAQNRLRLNPEEAGRGRPARTRRSAPRKLIWSDLVKPARNPGRSEYVFPFALMSGAGSLVENRVCQGRAKRDSVEP